jgi:small subunit ribosomal protein S6
LRGTPRDPRNYELMTVFSPDIPEEEIQATIDRVVGYITTATGEVVDVNRDSPWGRRRLAYPIRHASRDVRDGFYTLYHFAVAPHRVEDIEREIKLNDRIMRYLVTQHTPKPVEEVAPTAEGAEEGEQAEAAVASETPVAAATPPVASAEEAPAAEVESAPEPEPEAAAEPEAAPEPEPVAEPEAAAEPAVAAVDEAAPAGSADDEAGTEEATPPEEA